MLHRCSDRLQRFCTQIKISSNISASYGGDDLTVLVAPEDIATTIAEELEKYVLGRHVRYVASEELTCSEVARILGEEIGVPDLKWLVVPGSQVQASLEKVRMPKKMASLMVELQEGHHNGSIAEDDLRNRPTSLGKVKTADFAKEFAIAYHRYRFSYKFNYPVNKEYEGSKCFKSGL